MPLTSFAEMNGKWRRAWSIGSWIFLFAALLAKGDSVPQYLVYTGGFSDTNNKGIYAFAFNAANGSLLPLGLATEAKSPTYFAIHPNGRFLYAVVNLPDAASSVSSYEIDHKTGKLKLLNTVSARGANTCFVSVSHSGKYVLTANYASGSVASYPVMPDGSLGEAIGFSQHHGSSLNRERQREAHAHSINASPDDRFAIAADLGTDQLLVYRLKSRALVPNDPPFTKVAPGSGPRHFAFHPSGHFAYAVEELASSMTVFDYNAKRGVLREIQTISMLPTGFTGTNFSADVQIHPSGKFVYGSNRGDDTIAVFAVDAGSGKLTPVERVKSLGKTPRIFAIDPTGQFLIVANEDSSSLVVFRIDQKSGRLTATGEQAVAPKPTCIKFVRVQPE